MIIGQVSSIYHLGCKWFHPT